MSPSVLCIGTQEVAEMASTASPQLSQTNNELPPLGARAELFPRGARTVRVGTALSLFPARSEGGNTSLCHYKFGTF